MPARELDERFATVVKELLADARRVEFVPVLAGRYARERIRAGLPAFEPRAA